MPQAQLHTLWIGYYFFFGYVVLSRYCVYVFVVVVERPGVQKTYAFAFQQDCRMNKLKIGEYWFYNIFMKSVFIFE